MKFLAGNPYFSSDVSKNSKLSPRRCVRIFAADPIIEDVTQVTSAVAAVENILVGKIENLSSKTIDVDTVSNFNTTISDLTAELVSADSKPLNYSDVSFFSFHKNNNLNVSNVKGYFAKVKMSVTSSSKKELFSIGSEVSVSSK